MLGGDLWIEMQWIFCVYRRFLRVEIDVNAQCDIFKGLLKMKGVCAAGGLCSFLGRPPVTYHRNPQAGLGKLKASPWTTARRGGNDDSMRR